MNVLIAGVTPGSDLFASALRQEMSMLDADIDVSIIMPGAYHTGFNQEIIDSKAEWMKESSFFEEQLPRILKQEHTVFDILEKGKLDSLIPRIVDALTSDKPRFAYKAPRL